MLGTDPGLSLKELPDHLADIHPLSLLITAVVIAVIFLAPRITRKVPVLLCGLLVGMPLHFLIAWFFPGMVGPLVGDLPVTDFAPLCLLGFAPNVLLVHPSVEAKNVRELIALARRNPGMTYSSPGAGTSTHMAGELFQSMSDSKLTHVPYKGTSDAVLAVVRGDVQIVFSNLPPAMPLIKDGRVKALAVTTTGRVSLLPDLPTVSETGLNGYDVSVWFGAFAPAGLAPALVSRISNALMNAATDPLVSEKLIQQGFVVKILRPAEFSGFVRDEISKWTKVVRQAGIKAE
jgi:tripartite-type tricarboxylate transporter receptor subunit TctC